MSEDFTAPSGAEVISSGPEVTPPEPSSEPVESVAAPEDKPRSLDDDLKAVWKKTAARDEGGRFKAAEALEGDSPPETTDQVPQAPETPEVPVPNSWTAEAKAMWNKVPPELRPHLAKRETEAHTTISRQGQELKALGSVNQILERGRPVFQKYGIDEATGISQLIEANNYLERDPVNAIRDLAQAYGVDLGQFNGNPSQAPDQSVQRLQATVAQLQQQLHETRTHVDQRETQESERQVKTLEAQVLDFAKDKPDFSELENDVLAQIVGLKALIQQGAHPDLPANELLALAYKKAQRANDQAWEKHQKAEEQKRMEEARKRAADAKKSQPLNVKSSTANSAAPKTMDDTLKAIARRRFQS